MPSCAMNYSTAKASTGWPMQEASSKLGAIPAMLSSAIHSWAIDRLHRGGSNACLRPAEELRRRSQGWHQNRVRTTIQHEVLDQDWSGRFKPAWPTSCLCRRRPGRFCPRHLSARNGQDNSRLGCISAILRFNTSIARKLSRLFDRFSFICSPLQ